MILTRKNIIPIIIASIQWILTNLVCIDKLFFEYEKINNYWIATKILYLIFLVIAWCFSFHVYHKIKEGDNNYKRGFEIFRIYFVIIFLLLIILWPGTWSLDDIWELEVINTYKSWNTWHHFITGMYHCVLLQILPFPGGMILLQNVIVAICVAFAVTKLESTFEIKRLKIKIIDIFVKIVPFLLPPVLMYQFSGYRMGMYVYIELVALVICICAFYDKNKWSKKYIALFCFVAIITSTWRSESLIYMPIFCILLLGFNEKIITNFSKKICIVIIALGFCIIADYQNFWISDKRYELTSLIAPCVELVRAADYIEDAEEIEIIDKYFDVNMIYNFPTFYSLQLESKDGFIKDPIDTSFNQLLEAIIKLSLKYPKAVFTERANVFLKSANIIDKSFINGEISATLFDEESYNDPNVAYDIALLTEGKVLGRPFFINLRKNFINFLVMKINDTSFIKVMRFLIWNTAFPILILIYAWIKNILNKKWYLVAIVTAILIKLVVVILTQPADWFMYSLSFYLLGYVYLVYKLLIVWSNNKKIKENMLNG